MKDKIETLAKKAQKKNANQKDIKLLNSANEAAAYLVELVNKERDENFSTLEAMHKYMEEKAMNQKKKRAGDSSEEECVEEEE
jgi:hypothetical protein